MVVLVVAITTHKTVDVVVFAFETVVIDVASVVVTEQEFDVTVNYHYCAIPGLFF